MVEQPALPPEAAEKRLRELIDARLNYRITRKDLGKNPAEDQLQPIPEDEVVDFLWIDFSTMLRIAGGDIAMVRRFIEEAQEGITAEVNGELTHLGILISNKELYKKALERFAREYESGAVNLRTFSRIRSAQSWIIDGIRRLLKW